MGCAALASPAALDAVVDACLARRLTTVELGHADLSTASVPALARLLGGGALTHLGVYGARPLLLDAPAAALLGSALRANATLTSLTLWAVQLWRDPGAGAALLGALTAHASLKMLRLDLNRARYFDDVQRGAVFTALGALVAADTPALRELHICGCGLADVGLGPLVDALPRNRHLLTLNCCHNDMSEAFARDRLLPAVRANTSLRELSGGAGHGEAGLPSAAAAAELVRQRSAL